MFFPNATLTKVTLRNAALVAANNHANGVSFANATGKIMVVLTSPAPTANAASNFTANIYAAPNADRDIKTSQQVAFTQVTNAASSVQFAEIDTRNLGPNVYLSSEVNILGASPNAGIALVAFYKRSDG